ncbi:hypothetical protein N4Q63_08225 [Leclercia adecarboxylata]|uniref:DUF551 domain-containing protein n=1 Tax=Leclercia adecarboxylata TaxID=83655 RepID=A0A9X3Y8P2_9ENTR|nr:hypothetical protein [Leclercia adecarboxylata]MBD1404253.1 hypothetical protein [Leclercia adecarboxylata]MDC6621882.1 hypothetical protein [Leclercia adecarboxylata]MDC6632954.1 hypothetical protein [Leclercia adecarboxylata]MDC6638250.1 hypothetical protein [Leclercia adecarboxylata]MDC6648993.1 hypothetical protein [Leclercia adecarboxylata]
MTYTKEEQIQAIYDLKVGYTLGHADIAMLKSMARQLLAGMEQEPVGEVVLGEYDDSGCHPDARVVCIAADGQVDWENFKDGTRLYAAPPAPVSVPDAVELDDDFDSAFEHGKAVGWNNYRAAMLQGAEPVSQPYTLRDEYCVMPLKLTAENGAKGALSGEFHVTNRIVCQSCAGEGCEDCNDEGGWDAEIPVSWDTIKRIHEAAVEACSLPATPQQEAE